MESLIDNAELSVRNRMAIWNMRVQQNKGVLRADVGCLPTRVYLKNKCVHRPK